MFCLKIPSTLKLIAKFTEVVLFFDLTRIRQHALNMFHCIFYASSDGESGSNSCLCLLACFRKENR